MVTQIYSERGYALVRNCFNQQELKRLKTIILKFHHAWKQANANWYATGAVNSADLTSAKYLNRSERMALFNFIGSDKLIATVNQVFDGTPLFMNTQLFFNPVNPEQKNYWHRDGQYHLDIEQQKQALAGPQVIHFRIPLYDEAGIEIIPGSHQQWDNDEELAVRMEQNGYKKHQDLSRGQCIPLKVGDLLIFSANAIHRGLYSKGRLAFDIVFCDPAPEFCEFIRTEVLPDEDMLSQLAYPEMFSNLNQGV